LALYYPRAYSFEAFDRLILELDEGTKAAIIAPLKITLYGSPPISGSRGTIAYQFDFYGLVGCRHVSSEAVGREVRSHRGSEVLVHPEFTTDCGPLGW
jgi:hypothetical protein